MITNDREELIVSMTDNNGRVTYVNRGFMRATGFSEASIVGQPHSKLRNDAVPKAVFTMMWETIRQQREFFCFLRNTTASGGAFWSFAAIYPHLRASGQIDGYHATHRMIDAPPGVIEALYRDLLQIETRSSGLKEALPILEKHCGVNTPDAFARQSLDLYIEQ